MTVRERISIKPALAQFNKVLVIGLGEIGLPVAKYVKGKGFDTYGYDISTIALDRAEKTAGIKKADDFGDYDVYILSISTHKVEDMSLPQTDGILTIADRISREAEKDGALVSIESTISKGTSKKVFEILNHRLHVVHAPHRWYASEEKEHCVNQVRVIGGVCDCCLRIGLQFYGGDNDGRKGGMHPTTPTPYKDLGVAMHPVSEVEIAEITKIAENADRYLQIAFAEELYLYCQADNINFPELRDALNTKWNVGILEPREGIGGHCLPKDTKMFLQSTSRRKNKILTAAIEVDEDYKKYRAKLEQQLESPSIEHDSK